MNIILGFLKRLRALDINDNNENMLTLISLPVELVLRVLDLYYNETVRSTLHFKVQSTYND